MLCPLPAYSAAKPAEVTMASCDREYPAEPPPELVTPGTASAASSAALARAMRVAASGSASSARSRSSSPSGVAASSASPP